jgi:hypothetical protein
MWHRIPRRIITFPLLLSNICFGRLHMHPVRGDPPKVETCSRFGLARLALEKGFQWNISGTSQYP